MIGWSPVLRAPYVRRYYTGQLLSVTCSWVQVVAVTSFVVDRDPGALGLVVTVQFLPMLLAPWFGALADRVDRRNILIAGEFALGVVALSYAALAATGTITVRWVALVATVWGVVNALDTPARQAFLTDLVPTAEAGRAVSLGGTVLLSAMTAGSAAGALLYGQVGLTVCCLVNAASFFADAALLATIRSRRASAAAARRGAVRDGLRYVRTTPEVAGPLAGLAVAGTLTFTFPFSVPVLSTAIDVPVGTLLAAGMGGSLLGMLVASGRGSDRVGWWAVGLGVSSAAVVVAPGRLGALAAVAVLGMAWSLFLAAVLTTLYQRTSPTMMGRVMAVFGMLLIGSTPVGTPIAATLADVAGPRAPFALGAVAAFAAAALAGSRLLGGPPAAATHSFVSTGRT